jgi:hypothetical protein
MQTSGAVLDNQIIETEPRTVLSVGAGTQELSEWVGQGHKVIRLDIEPRTNPDILGSMTNMGKSAPTMRFFAATHSNIFTRTR